MKILSPLLAHQTTAVEKLARLKVGGLFMDMGTGKTLAATEIARIRFEAHKIDRVVWFCPVSTKYNIRNEILAHTDVRPEDVYVFDAKTDDLNVPRSAAFVIVGIESMSSSNRVILATDAIVSPRTMVICDESSYIKGHRAKRTEWITDIGRKAKYRLILTGTPISQGVVDLFAQMRFLSTEILGYNSFYSFARNHLEYSKKYPGRIVSAHNVPWVSSKIAPYIYQVRKEDCLSLPPKTFSARHFFLVGSQRALYEETRAECLQRAEDAMNEHSTNSSVVPFAVSIEIFRMFTLLQSIAARDPHRLDLLSEAIRTIPAGEKIIVWSKLRDRIDAISLELSKIGRVTQYHGGLNEKQRDASLKIFKQPGGAQFLVATPQSGGHGLTLTEARYVIFFDNSFKLATRLQAEDRCHRIGQTRNVHYIDLIASQTIDTTIHAALSAKKDVADYFREKIEQAKDAKSVREALKKIL